MLQCYDFYDMYAVFTAIRSNPKYHLNKRVLAELIKVLSAQTENHDFNQIRQAIKPLLSEDSDGRFAFAAVDNIYTYFPMPAVKNNEIYAFLLAVCRLLLDGIEKLPMAQVADMADCFHNLPVRIVENNNSIPKSFWAIEVKNYREKWDKSFLSDEERLY